MNFGSSKFFTQVVHLDKAFALSSGYELKKFRNERLASLMLEALPDFALRFTEFKNLDSTTLMSKLKLAAEHVYKTDKFKSRGEFGELLLHLVLRDYFNTVPIVSKLFYKDSANNTVKGFDAVHVTHEKISNELNIWLGETKFYKDISQAISDVVKELNDHFDQSFLRSEFVFITTKADHEKEIVEKFQELISKNTSLDKVFKRIRVPVLLTYESLAVAGNEVDDEKYSKEVEKELIKHSNTFRGKPLPDFVEIILILVPLDQKEDLVKILDAKLKALQAL